MSHSFVNYNGADDGRAGRSPILIALIGHLAAYLPEYLIAFIVSAAAVISAAVMYLTAPESFLFFGDAVSHIVRARQFIDSRETGLVNLGTVWLPLPHLLLIPFVAFDALFYSGTAGAFLGIPLLAATAVIVYRLLLLLTDSKFIAAFFSLLLCLNPNILYMALTPMSELPLLFFLAAGGSAVVQYRRTRLLRWFLLASLAVLSATLCRYEAWILPPFLSLLIITSSPHDPRRRFGRAAASFVPWTGILFWFAWNNVRYGDPLMFAHWTFAVGTTSVRSALQDQPWEVFRLFGTAVVWIFGPLLTAAGLLMLFSFRRLKEHPQRALLLFYFLLPPLAVIAAVLFGFVQMDRWWWNWRFVLPSGLFLTAAAALAMKELVQKFRSPAVWIVVLAGCLLVPFVQSVFSSAGVAVYMDASKSDNERSRSAIRFGAALSGASAADTVALLTASGIGQRIMISSRLPLAQFIVDQSADPAQAPPASRYIVLGKDRAPETADWQEFQTFHRTYLRSSYTVLLEDDHNILYRRLE